MVFAKWLAAAASTVATVTMAGSALALSCAQPSIERSYADWSEAPEQYYVVSGTLTPAAPLPPIPSSAQTNGGNFDTSNLRGVYRVQGEVLYGAQTVPLDHHIWVRVGCVASWCGNFPSAGTSGVMALKQLTDGSLELYLGACPGSVFSDRNGSVKARVQRCMTSGCAPS